MRKLRSLLILGAAAICLSGCSWRNLGPCYGVGCPAFSSSSAPNQTTAKEIAPAAKAKRAKNALAHNDPAQTPKPAQSASNSGR